MTNFSGLRWWAAAGLIIPVAFYLENALRVALGVTSGLGSILLILWPSAILTMAIQQDFDSVAATVVAVSITINVIVYCAAGSIWCVVRAYIRRQRDASRGR